MGQRNREEIVADLIVELQPRQSELLAELMAKLITGTRVYNDEAKGEDVTLNQGEIRGYLFIAKKLSLPIDKFCQ